MANTELQNLDTAAAWSSTCSLAGSDSAFPTQSFKFPRSVLDAVYAQLAAATNIFTGNLQTQNVFIPGFGAIGTDVNEIRWTDGATGTTRLYSTGERDLRMATAVGGGYSSWRMSVGMMVVGNDSVIGWPNTFNADSAPDTAIGRASAGVVEVNNGTAGVLADIQARFHIGTQVQLLSGSSPALRMSKSVSLTWTNTTSSATTPIDTGIVRNNASVVEVNAGSPSGSGGTGGGINYPRTAADADMPAPLSGATVYSKQVGGKNALFVRFPTGAAIQLSIEP